MSLQEETLTTLRKRYSSLVVISKAPSIWYVNAYPVNVRTAARKSGDKFWFDVTPELYERRQVEFFLYVCGSPDIIYVFPRLNFEYFIRGASLGGQKQVPNFTLFADSNEFEPAGKSTSRNSIEGFRNAFFLIPNGR
jgi:hypothetical protein